MNIKYSVFESEISIRPDDIDMNGHVHNSKYFDYVLSARYDQMLKDYKMPMDDFLKRALGWVVYSVTMNFKRALFLGDKITVKTQVHAVNGAQVTVNFWIYKSDTGKLSADGSFLYTMVSTKTGRPFRIPEDIIKIYSV